MMGTGRANTKTANRAQTPPARQAVTAAAAAGPAYLWRGRLGWGGSGCRPPPWSAPSAPTWSTGYSTARQQRAVTRKRQGSSSGQAGPFQRSRLGWNKQSSIWTYWISLSSEWVAGYNFQRIISITIFFILWKSLNWAINIFDSFSQSTSGPKIYRFWSE